MNDDEEKKSSASPAGGTSGNTQTGGASATQLEEDLKIANQKIQELTDTAKRALADLQNYRKRIEEERAGFVQFANLGLILELLPILDNFQRAFAAVPDEIKKTDWFRGALQIEQQLVGVMKKQGVTEMPSSVGQKLDPTRHEALMTGPGEKETVIEEFEKGYMVGNKVIRPAKVKVGNGTKEEK